LGGREEKPGRRTAMSDEEMDSEQEEMNN